MIASKVVNRHEKSPIKDDKTEDLMTKVNQLTKKIINKEDSIVEKLKQKNLTVHASTKTMHIEDSIVIIPTPSSFVGSKDLMVTIKHHVHDLLNLEIAALVYVIVQGLIRSIKLVNLLYWDAHSTYRPRKRSTWTLTINLYRSNDVERRWKSNKLISKINSTEGFQCRLLD